MSSLPLVSILVPLYNNAGYIKWAIDSAVAQTYTNWEMIIVDDGSSDATGAILEEYAEKTPWIRVLSLPSRGRRLVGAGVVEAFYAGLQTVSLEDFDYLCKFDLDLEMPPQYFREMVNRMEREPRLGTCSGKPYFEHQFVKYTLQV